MQRDAENGATRMMRLVAAIALSILAIGLARADEQAVRRLIQTKLGDATVLELRKLPDAELYEVALQAPQGVRVIYVDTRAKLFIVGSLIDAASGENLTEARLRKLTAVDWSALPFADAITMRRGNGRREIAIFSDPNCPYCERFERSLLKVDDITVHIFMYPVIRPDSVRLSKAVWCSNDRAKAWNDLMFRRIEPKAKPDCDTPVERLLALGRKLGAASTPTWFLRNGEMHKGAVPMEEVVPMLDAAAAQARR